MGIKKLNEELTKLLEAEVPNLKVGQSLTIVARQNTSTGTGWPGVTSRSFGNGHWWTLYKLSETQYEITSEASFNHTTLKTFDANSDEEAIEFACKFLISKNLAIDTFENDYVEEVWTKLEPEYYKEYCEKQEKRQAKQQEIIGPDFQKEIEDIVWSIFPDNKRFIKKVSTFVKDIRKKTIGVKINMDNPYLDKRGNRGTYATIERYTLYKLLKKNCDYYEGGGMYKEYVLFDFIGNNKEELKTRLQQTLKSIAKECLNSLKEQDKNYTTSSEISDIINFAKQLADQLNLKDNFYVFENDQRIGICVKDLNKSHRDLYIAVPYFGNNAYLIWEMQAKTLQPLYDQTRTQFKIRSNKAKYATYNSRRECFFDKSKITEVIEYILKEYAKLK